MSSLSRRALLRRIAAGAGGAVLLPLMTELTAASPQITPRFVFILEGNCYEPVTVLDPTTLAAINGATQTPVLSTDRWWYDKYGHTTPIQVSSPQFANTIALGSIASNGLASRTAVVLGMSSRITGGGHSALHGVLSSTRSLGGLPGGPTIDAALAAVLQQAGPKTPYDAVRLGVHYNLTDRLDYGTCAYDRGRAAPLIVDPVAAYSTLFGLVGSTADQTAFNQRGNVLQFAQQDVTAALSTFGGNSTERAKLEAYLASLQAAAARQTQLMAIRSQLAMIAPTAPASNPLYSHNQPLNNDPVSRFASQLQLATAALRGGLTNVVVMGSGTGLNFDMQYPTANPAADASITRHNLHHGSAASLTYQTTIHDITK